MFRSVRWARTKSDAGIGRAEGSEIWPLLDVKIGLTVPLRLGGTMHGDQFGITDGTAFWSSKDMDAPT
jgi:hypothetical protein